MPWSNQPGGPWGSGSPGPGPRPPDLEEFLRRSQDKMRSVLPGNLGGRGIALIALAAIVLWGFSGFFRVEPDELGVVLRFGKFTREVQPGLNYHLPCLTDAMWGCTESGQGGMVAKRFTGPAAGKRHSGSRVLEVNCEPPSAFPYYSERESMRAKSKFILPVEPQYTGHRESERRQRETKQWIEARERLLVEHDAPPIAPEHKHPERESVYVNRA